MQLSTNEAASEMILPFLCTCQPLIGTFGSNLGVNIGTNRTGHLSCQNHHIIHTKKTNLCIEDHFLSRDDHHENGI
jgi:hypothetical protein